MEDKNNINQRSGFLFYVTYKPIFYFTVFSNQHNNKHSAVAVMSPSSPLPLPGRVPAPRKCVRRALADSGITVEKLKEKKKNVDEKLYVTYTLPEGWKMVDVSIEKSGLVEWVIVDNEDNIRFGIWGPWNNDKHQFKNCLNWIICKEPFSRLSEIINDEEEEKSK